MTLIGKQDTRPHGEPPQLLILSFPLLPLARTIGIRVFVSLVILTRTPVKSFYLSSVSQLCQFSPAYRVLIVHFLPLAIVSVSVCLTGHTYATLYAFY